MGRHFGTDGIRGVANADLSAELALDVGRAVAWACRDGLLGEVSGRPVAVIGRDTRTSGPMLGDALASGLRSAGMDVCRVGVLPSPAVAELVRRWDRAAVGIVLSASHNPAPDNGIKLFDSGGMKLATAVEDEIERRIPATQVLGVGSDIGGDAQYPGDPASVYIEALIKAVNIDLTGMRIVLDCANGAAHAVGPEVLRRLGATVDALFDAGDGTRINLECGATHPEVAARHAAQLGCIALSLDGDADRVLASDENGVIVDGDALIAIIAGRLQQQGRLTQDSIAVTVMANQALRVWAASAGINVIETDVGDRHVVAAMIENQVIVGGEQSGHVLRLDLSPTGDGLLTSLCLLEAMVESGRKLSDLVPFRPFPQCLVNVASKQRDALGGCEEVWAAVSNAETRLSGTGRVLLRPSGTEPLIRVMVEAQSIEQARFEAEAIAEVVRRELN